MTLVKVNSTDYINPDMVVRISKEEVEVKDKDASEITIKRVWTIYTTEGKIKVGSRFNMRGFIRECRDA